MQLNELTKIVSKSNRRVGRGSSSGRGKTAGRGTKGLKARGKSDWTLQGGSRRSRLIKNLPTLRGLRNPASSEKAKAVSLAVLQEKYSAGQTVSLTTLKEKNAVDKNINKVKILAVGVLDKALTVSLPVSESAKLMIEKAGGKVA